MLESSDTTFRILDENTLHRTVERLRNLTINPTGDGSRYNILFVFDDCVAQL